MKERLGKVSAAIRSRLFFSTAHMSLLILCIRYDLYSDLHILHEAGLLYGDVHPRNTVIAPNGKVQLVDLTEASEHKCPESRKMFPMVVCIVFSAAQYAAC